MAIILAVALVIRIPGMFESFWLDELHSVRIAEHGIGDILALLPFTDTHPPLYYIMLHSWMQVGDGDFWLRCLSLVLGLGLVGLVGGVAGLLGGRRMAFIAMWLAAVSPSLSWISYEARNFVLMNVMIAIAWLGILHALRADSWRGWILYALGSAGAWYSFYFSFVCSMGLAVFFSLSRPTKMQITRFALASTVAAILYLPWVRNLLVQTSAVSRVASSESQLSLTDAARHGLWHLEGVDPWRVVAQVIGVLRVPHPAWLVLAVLVGVVAYVLTRGTGMLKEALPRLNPRSRMPLFALGLVIIGFWTGLVYLGVFDSPRYVTFLAVWGSIVGALLIGMANRRLRYVILSVVVVCNAVVAFRESLDYSKEEWRQAVRILEENVGDQDLAASVALCLDFIVHHYRVHESLRLRCIPWDVPGVDEQPETGDFVRALRVQHLPAVGDFLDPYDRVWMVWSHTNRSGIDRGRGLLTEYLIDRGYVSQTLYSLRGIELEAFVRVRRGAGEVGPDVPDEANPNVPETLGF